MNKVQWHRAQLKNVEMKKQEEEAERNAMASIDWYVKLDKGKGEGVSGWRVSKLATNLIFRHDFVVVQTINFDEEEEVPAKQQQHQPAQPQQPSVPAPPKAAADEDGDADMDMEMEDEFEPDVGIQVRAGYDPRERTCM